MAKNVFVKLFEAVAPLCGGKGDTIDQSKGDDLYHQGLNCLQDGSHHAAINFFEKCIQFNRDHVNALYHLGQIHEEMGAFVTARIYYGRVLAIEEDNPNANFSLGSLYLNEEQYGKAEGYLQKAVELNPSDAEAWINLGLVRYSLDMPQAATAAFLECLAVAPERSKISATALYNLGNLQHKQGDIEGAINSFSRAVEIDNTLVDAFFNMGVLYQQNEAIEEAFNWYEKAAAADPTSGEARSAMDNIREHYPHMRKKELTHPPTTSQSLPLVNSYMKREEVVETHNIPPAS
mmetsp:Transcript_33139/g.54805  ORF Transcript_33139/g.54805 Transcript_33139/m.54805 type:complete len:291 (-) Transcript_33139:483-1355(-)